MIYEIAITPEALEELMLGKDAATNTERLASLLFPGDAKHGNVLVADLASDEWVRSIKAVKAKLPPQRTVDWRSFVLRLLELCEPHGRQKLVLDSERDWIDESKSGVNGLLIDRVFASSELPKLDGVEQLTRIKDRKWLHQTFYAAGPAKLTADEQAKVFSRLLRYSDWCFVDLPYLSSSLSNESVTALQLIEIATNAGQLRSGAFHIDIRCESSRFSDFEGASFIPTVERVIASRARNRDVSVCIYTDGGTKNRTLFAGTLNTVAGKSTTQTKVIQRHVKWRVVMPHVRIGSKTDSGQDGDWMLNDLHKTAEKFHELQAEVKSSKGPKIKIGNVPEQLSW